MIIELKVPDMHVKRLQHWASLMRTIKETQRRLDDNSDKEAVENCSNEWEDIGPAIEALHKSFQAAIMKRNVEKLSHG